MTKAKFHSEDWFNRYDHRLDEKQLKDKLSTLDGVRASDVSAFIDGRIEAYLEINIETQLIVRDNDQEANADIEFEGSYLVSYEIDKNLSSEDISQAEQNLDAAIKSGRTSFKIAAFARVIRPGVFINRSWIRDLDGRHIVDSEKVSKMIKSVMKGEEVDLDNCQFIRDLVPAPKDERIELICEVPEELMLSANKSSKQEFHLEDWMEYYNAKLDKDDLKDLIEDEDCSKATSIKFDGILIEANLESSISDSVSVESVDDETDEEIEYDVEIGAEFSYSVEYSLNTEDLEHYVQDFNEALNEALDRGESTFEIRVPFTAGEAYNVDVNGVEIYDDEVNEEEIYAEVVRSIELDLANPTDARHTGDFIEPPSDKMVRFICTIPENQS